MNAIGEPVRTGFDCIRQGLDPEYSYMFFERNAGPERLEGFPEVLESMRALGLHARERRLFLDEERGRFILMVKLEIGSAKSFMQDLLAMGLPEDITFYAYDSHHLS